MIPAKKGGVNGNQEWKPILKEKINNLTLKKRCANFKNRMGEKIAVIDDSKEFRHLIISLLENEDGFKAEPYFSGIDFIKTASPGQFDLIILDIDMPMLKGTDLFKHMRSVGILQQVPVLVITGMEEKQVMPDLFPLSKSKDVLGFDLLRKPLSADWLSHKVHLLLKLKNYRDRLDITPASAVK